MQKNLLLLNKIGEVREELEEERCTRNKENIILLIINARSEPKYFKKNRIDNNLEGSNNKFFLYRLGSKGYYTWILDIKYWDMFDIEIGLWSYNKLHDPEGLIIV